MTYALGIDLGTTYTAAAVARDGRLDVVDLGTRSAVIPSVVLQREDGVLLVGEQAVRRAASEPARVAREFKRRLGDPVPLLLGGAPRSAESLMAAVLRHVVEATAEREGGPPARIVVTHPANWGPYKLDLLRQAIALADLRVDGFLTEPEAAVTAYARQERVPAGATIAVYDLGGGTFDAAVLRKDDDRFTILGTPEGIERLGGIDFDQAVFAHVAEALGGALDTLDQSDPLVLTGLTRLREECVSAKEALSADGDAHIPVLLPGLQTEVRLTRAELEAMIRPTLADTITSLRRALRNAAVPAERLHAVLLVGGSSRIPLVGELVAAALGRPVTLDAHPKHVVALGAAAAAAGQADGHGMEGHGMDGHAGAGPTAEPAASAPTAATTGPAARPGPRRRGLLVAAVAAVVLLVGAGAALAGGRDDERTVSPGSGSTLATTAAAGSPDASTPATVTTAAAASPTTTAAVRPCSTANQRCAFIDTITVEAGRFVVGYTTVGFEPRIDGGASSHHLHFFFDTVPLAQAGVPGTGPWVVWDLDDTGQKVLRGEQAPRTDRVPPGATALCVTVATVGHAVDPGAVAECRRLP